MMPRIDCWVKSNLQECEQIDCFRRIVFSGYGFMRFAFIVSSLVFILQLHSSLPAQTDSQLSRIDDFVNRAIAAKKMPGAVVCIGNSQSIQYKKAFGHLSLKPTKVSMETDTIFDLASLTKPIATATSLMILVEEGKVRIRDRVSTYIPEFAQNGKRSVTIGQLLTHTSGLIPDNALSDYKSGRKVSFEKINALKPLSEPGTKFSYSDVGFLVLGEVIKKVSGKDVDQFAKEKIFTPLNMSETGFNPPVGLRERSAVTQQRNGSWIKGVVHDPRAFELDGVAGHAGLFSTADDLTKYCQHLLQTLERKETRPARAILSPRGIELMTKGVELPGENIRSLGWDKQSVYSSNRGELMTESAFGHGGFTGTAIWIDPELDLFVIFLSNRVHPDGKGSVNRLAGLIGTIAAGTASRMNE